MSTPSIPLGTVIHGTHRYVDLIPKFAEVVREHLPDDDSLVKDRNGTIITIAREEDDDHALVYRVARALGSTANTDPWEEVQWVMDDLLAALMDLADDHGMWFGAHEGDGSDFGFWDIAEDG